MYNKRVVADGREAQELLYSSIGLHYISSDIILTKGYACIFGPSGTPYEDCPMLYEIDFSSDFPYTPPKVEFKTYDGLTRFHPNMYREGKVCLSILHTWNGPRWASTMRLSTVLITLQSLLDTAPLRHEPGYEHGKTIVVDAYTKFIEIACVRYILDKAEAHINHKIQPEVFKYFLNQFLERLPATLQRLEVRLIKLISEGELHFANLPYQMQGCSGYKRLLDRVVKLKGVFSSQ
jgi:ubiquitin-conjugating enzyme E2 Z